MFLAAALLSGATSRGPLELSNTRMTGVLLQHDNILGWFDYCSGRESNLSPTGPKSERKVMKALLLRFCFGNLVILAFAVLFSHASANAQSTG